MARCCFLRRPSVSGLVLLVTVTLCIAIASSRRGRWVSSKTNPSVHRSVQAVRSTTALPPRGTFHRDLEKRSGMAVSLLQQPSSANNAQFIAADRSGFGHLKTSLRSDKTEHTAGDRRLQDACDTQRSALNFCLPTVECVDCYESAIAAIFNQTNLCGVAESRLCSISTTSCSSCMCESEAENYYKCLLEDLAACDIVVNCADTECEAELIASDACFDNQDIPCNTCVVEAVDALYSSPAKESCQDYEDAICTAIYDRCGCDQCSELVEAFYACELPSCTSFECFTHVPLTMSPSPTPSTPASTPVVNKTPRDAKGEQSANSPGGGGGGSLAALSALVAIPLMAVIVYLVKNKKREDGPVSNKPPSNSAAPVDDYNETPPTTPSSNRRHAHTPASQHQQTNPSRTASMRSDEDYIYGRRHDDRDLVSIGDVSAGSGRSQDIFHATAGKNPVPYASPVSSVRSTGGHTLRNKDCCRSVACEAEVPVAVIVEEVVPPGVERVYGKRGADP